MDYIHDRLPLAQACCLYSAICTRHKKRPLGPTYDDQDFLAALERGNTDPMNQ